MRDEEDIDLYDLPWYPTHMKEDTSDLKLNLNCKWYHHIYYWLYNLCQKVKNSKKRRICGCYPAAKQSKRD